MRPLAACALAVLASLAAPLLVPARAQERARKPGDAIIVAGDRVKVGVPVVTWRDPGGFDGYLERCAFTADRVNPRTPADGCDEPKRYGARRHLDPELETAVAAGGWTRRLLGRHVDQVVVHYDECGTSRKCFEVLHDLRGLSCHFLLDLDGTLYQTLDLVDRARHAGDANDRSVGIEIAHPGLLGDALAKRYRRDGDATIYDPGAALKHVRTPGFVARPARPEPITGPIHGRPYSQYDFTEEQYRTLIRLLAELADLFPRLKLDAPRDAQGAVRTDALSKDELAAFSGVIGHHHVTRSKQDPGPAFDWERVLSRARTR